MTAHRTLTIAIAGAFLGLTAATTTTSFAQPRMQWINEINGDGNDIGAAMAVDSHQNVVSLSWSETVGGDTDVVVEKYDRTGKFLWSATWGGQDQLDDTGVNLVIDSNDDIYVSGTSESATSGSDFMLLKFDANGDFVWEDLFDGSGNGTDYSSAFGTLAIDAEDNIYLAGFSWSADGLYEFMTIRYDGDGNQVWKQAYRGPNASIPNSYGWALEVSDAGDVYVAGDAANLNGDFDYTLVKYDSEGNFVWDAQFDGVYGLGDSLYDLAVDANGNAYLTGISDTSGGFEYCVAKFDDGGNFLWEGRYGGTQGYHYGWVIDVDDLGNAYVSGASMTGGGEYDMKTVKFDAATGAVAWANTYRDNFFFGEDWAYGIKVGPDGNIYVGGYISQWFYGGFDMAVVKYDPSGALVWDEIYEGLGIGGNETAYNVFIDDDLNVYVPGVSTRIDTGSDAVFIKYSQSPAPSLTISPDPLIAGQTGTFECLDFEPFTDTYLAYSTVGEGEVFVPFLNIGLGLAQPQQAAFTLTTDAGGDVTWNLPIPPDVVGLQVWFQAAQYNQVTNIVTTVIQ